MKNETKTEISGACEITVLFRNDFNPPRDLRYENGKWVEYLYGRRVITHEEMREMDFPWPPEDEDQNPIE